MHIKLLIILFLLVRLTSNAQNSPTELFPSVLLNDILKNETYISTDVQDNGSIDTIRFYAKGDTIQYIKHYNFLDAMSYGEGPPIADLHKITELYFVKGHLNLLTVTSIAENYEDYQKGKLTDIEQRNVLFDASGKCVQFYKPRRTHGNTQNILSELQMIPYEIESCMYCPHSADIAFHYIPIFKRLKHSSYHVEHTYYDAVPLSEVCYKNISFNDISAITQMNQILLRKTYTPPEGDTEEYQTIYYYENDDINFTVYEANGTLRLAGGCTKQNAKAGIAIFGTTVEIGQHESVLKTFNKSFTHYQNLKKKKKSDEQPPPKFHLMINNAGSAQPGILTIEFSNDLIKEISFSLDPA